MAHARLTRKISSITKYKAKHSIRFSFYVLHMFVKRQFIVHIPRSGIIFCFSCMWSTLLHIYPHNYYWSTYIILGHPWSHNKMKVMLAGDLWKWWIVEAQELILEELLFFTSIHCFKKINFFWVSVEKVKSYHLPGDSIRLTVIPDSFLFAIVSHNLLWC